MDKIFKILIIFTLMTFVIHRFIRGKARKFREYHLLHRIPEMPPADDEPDAYSAVIAPDGTASITDPAAGMVYEYSSIGVLSIHRQGSQQSLQHMLVPKNAYYLWVDPVHEEIRLHHDGEVYVFTRES